MAFGSWSGTSEDDHVADGVRGEGLRGVVDVVSDRDRIEGQGEADSDEARDFRSS